MAAPSPGPVVEPRYAAALGDDDPVSVMAETPDRIRKLIRGLTEKQLETKPAPGKWCIKEIVAHLADGEVILRKPLSFHRRARPAGASQLPIRTPSSSASAP